MTTTVNKTTVIENIYKNFYDLINAISGFSGTVYPSFPKITIDNKSDYPIIIIDSPDISWETFTFGKGILTGTTTVDIYTTDAKTTDQYASDISNQIEVSKYTLATMGLRQIKLTGTAKDSVSHGKIRVHLKTLNFEYKFYYAGTRAF